MEEEVSIIGLKPACSLKKKEQREGWAAVYEQYQTDICKYIRRIFGKGPPDPEDVTQQVFINFMELEDKNEIQNPRAYLYRIAHNLVSNLHRKTSTRRRYIADQKTSPEDNGNDDFHPERILIARERLMLLERVMWKMPPKRRQMVILNRLKGMTYAEISRQTGQSKSVVRQHVLNGLQDFQKAMRQLELQNQKTVQKSGVR